MRKLIPFLFLFVYAVVFGQHGLDEFNAKWGPTLEEREPVRVAHVEGGIKPHWTLTVDEVILGRSAERYSSHATMCSDWIARWNKQKIHIVDVYGLGLYGAQDGMNLCLGSDIVACNTSQHFSSGQGMTSILAKMREQDRVWVAPNVRDISYPAQLHKEFPGVYTNVLISICVTDSGYVRDKVIGGIPAIATQSAVQSQSSAYLAGAYGLLKCLKPSADHVEIIAAMFAGAENRTFGGKRVKWLRIDRAADILMDGVTTLPVEPDPEPSPEPVPDPVPEPEVIIKEVEVPVYPESIQITFPNDVLKTYEERT